MSKRIIDSMNHAHELAYHTQHRYGSWKITAGRPLPSSDPPSRPGLVYSVDIKDESLISEELHTA